MNYFDRLSIELLSLTDQNSKWEKDQEESRDTYVHLVAQLSLFEESPVTSKFLNFKKIRVKPMKVDKIMNHNPYLFYPQLPKIKNPFVCRYERVLPARSQVSRERGRRYDAEAFVASNDRHRSLHSARQQYTSEPDHSVPVTIYSKPADLGILTNINRIARKEAETKIMAQYQYDAALLEMWESNRN